MQFAEPSQAEKDKQKYLHYAEKALRKATHELKQLETFREEYQQLNSLLHDLPGKLSHEVMVPLSKVGFMKGQLKHTNEFLVLLGDNYFATKSGKSARELVQRRLDYLKIKIQEKEATVLNLRTKYQITSGTTEIIEEIEDEEEDTTASSSSKAHPEPKAQPSRPAPAHAKKPDYDAILARISQLAEQEEAEERERESEAAQPQQVPLVPAAAAPLPPVPGFSGRVLERDADARKSRFKEEREAARLAEERKTQATEEEAVDTGPKTITRFANSPGNLTAALPPVRQGVVERDPKRPNMPPKIRSAKKFPT